jgi:signal peptidase I
MSNEAPAFSVSEPRVQSVSSGSAQRQHRTRERQGHRESVETFVVVFLGFLTWSLEAEGFVIPTGSMAPTLMGRHKEVTCGQCGHVYTVNADREVDNSGRGLTSGSRIDRGTCENCRYETSVKQLPSFSGDRVYVTKTGIGLPFVRGAEPMKLERWDVAVFKLPEEPEVRYIKRLVGMPDEVVRISGGNLWVKPLHGGEFSALHRPFAHQQAMQVTVWDDSHRPTALREHPSWQRWTSYPGTAWLEPVPGTFRASSTRGERKELRYRHIVPRPSDWESINAGTVPGNPPRPTLITDFLSYNTDATEEDLSDADRAARPWFQPHWVGDLTLSSRVIVRERTGKLTFELIRSGVSNRCEIDLASGDATLVHDQAALSSPVPTGISVAGEYDIVFANVDGRLVLNVNGHLPFGEGLDYIDDTVPLGPTAADLEPARIATDSDSLEIQSLVLKRDVHYTLNPSQPDFASLGYSERKNASEFFNLLADPDRFALLAPNRPRDFPIRPGHYMMLGDNSPWSRDSRAWGINDQIDPDYPSQGWDSSGRANWEVPEHLLIGKAFCVYWPHLKPIWPDIALTTDTRVPVFPYFERMRWIR